MGMCNLLVITRLLSRLDASHKVNFVTLYMVCHRKENPAYLAEQLFTMVH